MCVGVKYFSDSKNKFAYEQISAVRCSNIKKSDTG